MLFVAYMAAIAGLIGQSVLINRINKRQGPSRLGVVAGAVNLATVVSVICLYWAAGGWS